jgi:hypothetical protein
MEEETPFVSLVVPYGKMYWLRILQDWRNNRLVFGVVVETRLFKNNMHSFLKQIPSFKEEDVHIYTEKEFRNHTLLSFQDQKVRSSIFGVYERLLYFLPNRVRPTILTTLNVRILELAFKEFDREVVPDTFLYGTHTASFPAIQLPSSVLSKHEDGFFSDLEWHLSNKTYTVQSSDTYPDMTRKIFRLHLNQPGRTIVFLIADPQESETVQRLLKMGRMEKFRILEVCQGEHNYTIREGETVVYISDEEHLHLMNVPVDTLMDCGIGMRIQRIQSIGGNTSVRRFLPKEELLSRASVLQSLAQDNLFGNAFVMISADQMDRANKSPYKENTHALLLRLSKTNIDPVEILTPSLTIRKALLELESIGALTETYQSTDLGRFLLQVSLSTFEGAVLWNYLDQEWGKRNRSMWAVLWTTCMITLFDTKEAYYEYPPYQADGILDIIQQQNQHKSRFDAILGKDDVETFLKLWRVLDQDMQEATPENPIDYLWFQKWGNDHSLNGPRLYQVYMLTKHIAKQIESIGYVYDGNKEVDVFYDGEALRRVYSKVYLLHRFHRETTDVLRYTSYSTHSLYTVSTTYAINTIQRTQPDQVVCPILSKNKMLVSVLYRRSI